MKNNLRFVNGWGFVWDENGYHLVYLPLWDPPKLNDVGRAILITMQIKMHWSGITNAKAQTAFKAIVKEQSAIVAAGYSKAMDDDTNWCGTPPYPRPVPGSGGPWGLNPENPIFNEALGEKYSAQINAKASLTMLGKALGNNRVLEAAAMI